MTEPRKPKTTPLRDYYNPNVCFAIIFAAFLAMLFFRGDELFGAVALRLYYFAGGIVSFFIAGLCIVGLLALWGRVRRSMAAVLTLMILVGGAAGFFVLLYIGAYTWLLAGWISPAAIIAGTVVTLVLWLYSRWSDYFVRHDRLLKNITLAVLILTPFYLDGAAFAKSSFSMIDSEKILSRVYYLAERQGHFEFAESVLEMWVCNEYGFSCQAVYQSPPLKYPYPKSENMYLVFDEAGGTISVVVNGEVLFIHQALF